MILSIIALVISALAVVATLLIYRLASAPNIVVYLDGRSGSDVVIVVENTGRNVAHDITFSKNKNNDDDAIEIESSKIHNVLASITCLVPNQKRIFWGPYSELLNNYENRVVTINVQYFRSHRTVRIKSSRYFSLDITVLSRSLFEQNDLKSIRDSLEDISNSLNRISNF